MRQIDDMSKKTKTTQQSIVNNSLENAAEAYLQTEPPKADVNDGQAYLQSQLSRKDEENARLRQEIAILKQTKVVEYTTSDELTQILMSKAKIKDHVKNAPYPIDEFARLLAHTRELHQQVLNTAKEHYSNRPWSDIQEQLETKAAHIMKHNKPQSINC